MLQFSKHSTGMTRFLNHCTRFPRKTPQETLFLEHPSYIYVYGIFVSIDLWLIDWLNGVLRRFQQYFSNITVTAACSVKMGHISAGKSIDSHQPARSEQTKMSGNIWQLVNFLNVQKLYISPYPPSSIAQSVVYRTWEQEVARSIPGSANILSED